MVLLRVKETVMVRLIISVIVGMLVAAGCNKKDSGSLPDLTSEKKRAETTQHETDDTSHAHKVLVEVDGKTLTQSEADEKINKSLSPFKGRIAENQLSQYRAEMLKQLVDEFVTRTLLTEAILKNGVTVSDAEIADAMSQITAQLPDDMTLEAVLSTSGMTEEELRSEIKFNLQISKVVAAQTPDKKTPTDKEIEDYYISNKKNYEVPESVHARHILIKVEKDDDQKTKDAKKSKAEALQKQLATGADFATLAKESSECKTGKNGGDLGTFHRGQLGSELKPLEDAAFSQEVNAISPIVETALGYHIVQVLEHNQPATRTLPEVKDAITNSLQQQRMQDALVKYIAALKSKAHIVYAPEVEPGKK